MKSVSWIMGFCLLLVAGRALGQRQCDVTAFAMHFGSYNTLTSQDATGKILITCDVPTTVTVKLDPGRNSGGSFQPRKMRSIKSNDTLAYNLYLEANHSRVWGDGTSNTYIQRGIGELVIYGHIPARQKARNGLYIDTVTVITEW